MRKILISEKGEFKKGERNDYFRGAAVKMMASVIGKIEGKNEKKVIVEKKKDYKIDDLEKA